MQKIADVGWPTYSGATRPFWGGKYPGSFSRCSKTYPGWALGLRLFFAFHLTLGGKVDICGRDDLFFFSLDFGQETDVTTFKEPVLLLRSKIISGPAGMAF